MTREWKLREECEHGHLGRSCEICERDEEIAELRAEVERLRNLLSRDAKDAKHALIRVDCRCHAWRACQAIRDRLRDEEVKP